MNVSTNLKQRRRRSAGAIATGGTMVSDSDDEYVSHENGNTRPMGKFSQSPNRMEAQKTTVALHADRECLERKNLDSITTEVSVPLRKAEGALRQNDVDAGNAICALQEGSPESTTTTIPRKWIIARLPDDVKQYLADTTAFIRLLIYPRTGARAFQKRQLVSIELLK